MLVVMEWIGEGELVKKKMRLGRMKKKMRLTGGTCRIGWIW
jgi:hypothetical protein